MYLRSFKQESFFVSLPRVSKLLFFHKVHLRIAFKSLDELYEKSRERIALKYFTKKDRKRVVLKSLDELYEEKIEKNRY